MKRKTANSRRKGPPPKFNPKQKFDQKKDVRAIARERVGTVKPSRTILPPTLRKKPKHKRPPGEMEE